MQIDGTLFQSHLPSQPQFSPKGVETVDKEIAKLVLEGVHIVSSHEQ